MRARLWLLVGSFFSVAVALFGWDRQLYVLGAAAPRSACCSCCAWLQSWGRTADALYCIMDDLHDMPRTMRQLARGAVLLVVRAVRDVDLHDLRGDEPPLRQRRDATSAAYNEGANWVGVLFAAYNGFAALAAIVIPSWCARSGLRMSHLVNLSLGGLGPDLVPVHRDPRWLLLSMVGVGFAWASILSLPYAMLSDACRRRRWASTWASSISSSSSRSSSRRACSGLLVRVLFGGERIYALVIGGVPDDRWPVRRERCACDDPRRRAPR